MTESLPANEDKQPSVLRRPINEWIQTSGENADSDVANRVNEALSSTEKLKDSDAQRYLDGEPAATVIGRAVIAERINPPIAK